MPHFSLYPVGGDNYLLVALVAAALVALLLVGPGRERTSYGRRITLMAVRLAVILLILLIMLRPTLVYTRSTRQSATLVILADQSRSMSVRDEANGRNRWETLQGALANASAPLAKLASEFEVKAYAFDGQLHPAELADGRVRLGDKPQGQQTALGAVLEDVQREHAGKRLLGVILLSDGAQRARPPRDALPQTAAEQLRNSGPVYAVRLGKSRGLGQTQDVAVTSLVADPRVFVKNVLTVTGQVRIDGFVNNDVLLQLMFETEPGKMAPVAQATLKATTSGQLLPYEFHYAPGIPGEFKLSVVAKPTRRETAELVTTNNQMSTFVHVLSGGLNVLYLEGTARVEAKFLRRSLDASPDINVQFVRLNLEHPESRPEDMAERFKPGKYDVYVLGDLDSGLLKPEEMQDLADRVKQGAGLIMLGGYQSFGPGGYFSTPLNDVLPVVMDRFERQKPEEPIRSDAHLEAGPAGLKMLPTQLGKNHFSLMLGATPRESMEMWRKLPGLEGANKLRRVKPGALVLAETDSADPLLVSQNFGLGRVLAFTGDSTWHWWMEGYDAAHKRFWRQVILWLARKDESQESNVWLRLTERRFMPGQPVDFQVGAQLPSGEPAKDATFAVTVTPPGGKPRTLQVVQDHQDHRGSVRETELPGDYTLAVEAQHAGQTLGRSQARFTVLDQDLELDNSSADADMLQTLASITGGHALPPEDLPALIKQLSKDTESLEIQAETKRTLWDSWYGFFALVALLGVEWYLRKRWGLV